MELEFHQLELRYEFLRIRRPEHERRMLVSLDEVGQQVPIVVVQDVEIERYVVIDGHKRLRALRRLGRDAIAATCWDYSEAEALVVSRLAQTGESETALEQSWLLAELRGRFGRSMEELARQFQRSKSWISRRLALVDELPASLQERVRCGELTAHVAEKYLVPLARANREACLQLVEALGKQRLSSREMGILYTSYRVGSALTRQRLLAAPLLFLKTFQEAQNQDLPAPEQGLRTDLEILSSVARRAHRRLRQGALGQVSEHEREELAESLRRSLEETQRMAECFAWERINVGSGKTYDDSATASAGA